MLIYSKKIIQFVQEIKKTIKEILSDEIGVRVERERFYEKNFSYPIRAVIYNSSNRLGYFDANFFELGINECLMHSSRELLRNVIRHELAHYFTFIHFGETATPHSAEFKAFCLGTGWGEEVYQAAFELDEKPKSEEENSILRKVQKLMALSTSSNKNEAELAMIKSQQLLLKHNLEFRSVEERIVLKRVLKQKKKDAKMTAIARILETFFVSIVFSRGVEYTCIEIVGDVVNVEIAEYVATVLQGEFDHLWRETTLKGLVAKNSFFHGLAKGYCDKIQALKRGYNRETTTALMVIEKQLIDAKAMVYSRLSTSRSSGIHCKEASLLGEQMGRNLRINPALKSPANSGCLIGWK